MTLSLPLFALAAAASVVGGEFDDVAFYCDVRPVVDLKTAAVDEMAAPRKLQVWYGRFPVPDVKTDENGMLAFVNDPSDLFPDEYYWRNELPQKFLLFGKGEWLRTVRIWQAHNSNEGQIEIMIASVRQGEAENAVRIQDVLKGTCRKTRDAFEEFYREVRS